MKIVKSILKVVQQQAKEFEIQEFDPNSKKNLKNIKAQVASNRKISSNETPTAPNFNKPLRKKIYSNFHQLSQGKKEKERKN